MTVETVTYESPVAALVALDRTLDAHEQPYQMGSAGFFALYQSGKLGDIADFV
jgi:hypothetical protein